MIRGLELPLSMVKLSSLRTDRYLKYKLNQNQSKFTNYRKPFSISDTGHCQNIWKPKSHQVIACKNRRLHLIQLFSVGVFPDAGCQSDHSISKLVWPFDPSDLTWICWPDPNFFANTNPYKWALHVSLIQHAAASMRLIPSIWINTILSKMYKTNTTTAEEIAFWNAFCSASVE